MSRGRDFLFDLRWRHGFRREKRCWAAAESREDVGALIAAWLIGDSRYLPGQCAPGPYEVTPPGVMSTLAALNRRGLLTTVSQPAAEPGTGDDGAIWTQRAAVEFIVTPATAQLIRDVVADTGVLTHLSPIIKHLPPLGDRDRINYSNGIAVSTRNAVPVTVFGGQWYADELCASVFDRCAHRVANRIVEESVCLTVYDPEFGRDDRVWPALAKCVAADIDRLVGRADTDGQIS